MNGTDGTSTVNAYDLGRDELSVRLCDQPRYRVDQIWHGLYAQGLLPRELTTLPKTLRTQLASMTASLDPILVSCADAGQTIKWLWGIGGGYRIETVLMHYEDRSTACVSTQAGCAMGCVFCATGQAGFDRQLSSGEIIEQVIHARRRASEDGRRLSNVVFMGMGEPLANYEATFEAVGRIHDDMGISARHLTISTVGIVPGIRRMATEALPVNLAVSLHAANDALRDSIVPINRRYPLSELIEACHDYLAAKNRRLSFEWALMDHVNDRDDDAHELAQIARRLHAHVNLIPLNPTPGYPKPGSPPDRVRHFRDLLRDLGVNVTVRANRGDEIDAACGQLRANHETAR